MFDSLMNSQCPRCGAVTDAALAGGVCPACLLRQAAYGTGDDEYCEMPWNPPEAAELTFAFPQFEIIELIGVGGMGAVYKARQKSLGRLVALKILAPGRATNPDFAERFSREAKTLAEVNHPNIVTVHDFGKAGEFYFLSMEFIDGANLRQVMSAGRLKPEQALAIVPPICEALQFAHDHGIVHRDIKPENLLLDKCGRIKIADFGIARLLRNAPTEVASEITAGPPGAADLTLQSVLGTPEYMAPEQRDSPASVDHRADIFSLGVVLYEMLTGKLPGAKLESPSKLVTLDVRLDEIVLRALDQNPELRFQTAVEFRTEVETVTNSPKGTRNSQAEIQRSRPRVLKTGWVCLITPEQFATYSGQVFAWRHRGQLVLNEEQLTFSQDGTMTVIPLTAIRDLSLGHYPRLMFPLGADFLRLNFEDEGQSKSLILNPFVSLFGWPPHFREMIADWHAAIGSAVTAVTGRAPATTPANEILPAATFRRALMPIWMALLFVLIIGVCLQITIFIKRPEKVAAVHRRESSEPMMPSLGPPVNHTHPPFVASYGEGTVELVALAPHPSLGQNCWQPDGSPSTEVLPTHGGHSWAEGKKVRELLLRVQSRPGSPSPPVVRFDRLSKFSGMGSSIHPANATTSSMSSLHQFAGPPDARQFDVQVGIADGPWETTLTFERHENQDQFGASQSRGDGLWEGTVQTTSNDDASIALAFSYTHRADYETHLAYLKTDGTIQRLQGMSSRGTHGLTHSIVSLSQDEFATIKQFQLQRRRYQWVEFRNVSLEPGFKTVPESRSVDQPSLGG